MWSCLADSSPPLKYNASTWSALGSSQASWLVISVHRPGVLSYTSYGLSGLRAGSAVRGESPIHFLSAAQKAHTKNRGQGLLCCPWNLSPYAPPPPCGAQPDTPQLSVAAGLDDRVLPLLPWKDGEALQLSGVVSSKAWAQRRQTAGF